jgi:tripartite-type tricarboxylate transporter receptor subunit TctC
MKKILLSLITMLSLTANAGTTVPIVWPFSISSNQANFIRLIIEEANKQQDKYTFIFENKPGAGGTLAAQYVLNYNGIAIISSSSSFFVRPQFYPYPKESHRVEDFRPVMVECVNQPYGIISTKYKSFDELRKQERVTIGANYGSLTEAMARELQRALPNTQVDIIPFASGLKVAKLM